MSKTATCGTSGSARSRVLDRPTSAGALCSGASSVERGELALDVAVEHDRLAEPRAAVHDAVRDRLDAARHVRAASRPSRRPPSRATAESFRLVEPALTTRIVPTSQLSTARSSRGRPDGPRRARASTRARMRASTISWRSCPARVGEAGHAVDHVHHEVVAVEVVEHDHVERRRRRALLLVAAHVEVRRGSCAR